MATFVAAVQAGDGATANVTALSLTIPAGLAAGDRLVLFVDSNDSAMAFTTPTGWTLLDGPRANGTQAATAVLERVIVSGDPGSAFTITFTSGSARAVMFGQGFTGVGSGTSQIAVQQDPSAVSTYTLPTLTGVAAGAGQVCAFLRRRSGTAATITVPSPYAAPTPPDGSPATAAASGVNVFTASGYVASSAGGTVGGESTSTATTSLGTQYLVAIPPAGGTAVGVAGAPATVAAAAPAGTVSGSAAASGVVASVAATAPAGTVAATKTVTLTGPVAAVAATAPAGAVSVGGSATVAGVPATVAAAAHAGSVTATSNTTIAGLVAAATAQALAGLVDTGSGIPPHLPGLSTLAGDGTGLATLLGAVGLAALASDGTGHATLTAEPLAAAVIATT